MVCQAKCRRAGFGCVCPCRKDVLKREILFAGEEIEYYISEQDENGEKTGEKHLLQREEAMDAWPETGVELLNRMNHAIQTEDSQAVNEMICSYERINEMTEQLFELK